ncbi:hypothetical protein GL325_02185 [Aeromicrobium sp. 636]|uniref:Acetate--CoA ligase family protein n=1 Tax=Aeromicrobium senzhongii TaxID=2663859 RepID=A0A8I0EU59_9ACTN|nr:MULTISPECIES: acetate--CoA ligase family protein [Aeromicrobium]MBC9225125.1 acetate--CoA ligase family protein [Aeromicrobium senzhongii]MCQ3997235.1 hypothetical protein [Aeromicrobium sp. 636]
MTQGAWRSEAVRALMKPRSVAVVGARPQDSIGGAILRNLANSDIPGGVTGISRRAVENQAFPFVESLEEVTEVPEIVLAAVGSRHVPEIVEASARLGAKAVVIFDGGFADIGSEGLERQRALRATADEAGMALLGPNCYGIANRVDGVALFAQEVRFDPQGTFALISNSGGVTDQIVGDGEQNVEWGYIVTTGNEASLSSADFLAELVDRENCEGICLFVETIRDPERFFEACEKARSLHKPIIVLRVGRTDLSRDAAAAHTGALAPPARLLDAKLKHHGVIVVDTIRELLTTAALFQTGHRPTSGVALAAQSGGLIELLHDSAPDVALTYPGFHPSTVEKLNECLGPYIHKSNPLDWYPSPREGILQALDAVGHDPNVDTVVIVTQYNYLGPVGSPDFGGGSMSLEAAYSLRDSGKLVILPDPLAAPAEAVAAARLNGAVVTADFGTTLLALNHLYEFSRSHDSAEAPTTRRSAVSFGRLPRSGQGAMDLLGKYAPVSASVVVDSVEEGLRAAQRMGFPLVAKLGSEDIQHKSDIGGVKLGIENPEDLTQALTELLGLDCGPILVQQQASKGIEVIAGVHTDPALGEFLVVGAGGVWTEILKDSQISVLGISRKAIYDMLTRLQIWPLLQGARGEKPVDIEALIDVIEGVDRLGQDLSGQIESIDVNPIIATPGGAVAVDIAIFPRDEGDATHSGTRVDKLEDQ